MEEYTYKIYPYYDKVKAEITKQVGTFKLHALDKSFGSNFRKPIEKDYLDAEIWAKNQLKYINNANKK